MTPEAIFKVFINYKDEKEQHKKFILNFGETRRKDELFAQKAISTGTESFSNSENETGETPPAHSQ